MKIHFSFKNVIILSGILSILFHTGCNAIYVYYDYDKEKTFDAYETYQFDLEFSKGLSDLDERRLIRYTDSVLKSNGLKPAAIADLFIQYHAEEYEAETGSTLGVGVGGTGGSLGVGVSGGIPIGSPSIHRRIVVTIIDRQKNEVIWEADSDSKIKEKITPPQRDAFFKKLTEKIFKKFPRQSQN